MDSFSAFVAGFIIILLLLISFAFWPQPECRRDYVYVWRAHACLEGYRP